MGQVLILLSLLFPLQGDRREEPPRYVSYLFLFSRDPRFQGPTEPRTRWGLRPAPLHGRSAPSRPRLCNSPGQRGRGCQLPPLAATTSPAALLHARARTEAHTSMLADPGPLCFKHTPLPHL